MVSVPPVPGPDFRVLGPVEVLLDGRQVPVPAGTQRTLLALLLLSRGRPVSTTRLLDGLWGDEQPQDPRASLHTAVARLRRTLGTTGGSLRTLAPGYVLDLPPEALDSERFANLHARARALLGSTPDPDGDTGRAAEAALLLRTALGLWRGAAWGEHADGVASGDALRLEEARLAAHEDLAKALIASGQDGDAVATLESVVQESPLRDRAVALLVDALHRYGRTADALSTYESYRSRLADELGLDPSPPLAALQQRVLRQELPVSSGAFAGASVPAQRLGTAAPPPPSSPGAPGAAEGSRPSPRASSDRLVGRDREVEAVSGLVEAAPLVTLVGPGGVGKSRLAQHVAESAADTFFWVDLAPVRDRPGVVQALADALGVEARTGRAVESAVQERLGSEPGLVVLDNCEHVLDAVAAVLSSIVGHAASVLATSRERLGVNGERVFVLDPLELPAPGTSDADAPAVELFLTRAADAGVDLSVDSEVVRRVGEVCRALDGLPLALELGAARMGSLTLEDLADRLDRRFELLTRGPRTAPRRHRTLRSVVDWSFELLEDEERAVFTRLSVFPSGFDLAAAEAVVADGSLDADRVADVVAQLTDRSMVVRPAGAGRGKYRLLESLRQYAASRLLPQELASVRRRHALWAINAAERAREGLEGPEEAHWSDVLEDMLDDLRAVWRWAREAEDLESAGRLLSAICWWAYWRLRADVLCWGSQLLTARPDDAPPVACTTAAACAWLEGDLEEAERVAELAFSRFDEGARDGLYEILGDVYLSRSSVERALESYGKAERVRASRGDRMGRSVAASNLVLGLAYADLPREAEVARALTLAAEAGSPTALAFARYAEGEAYAEQDEPRALDALEDALRLADGVRNRLVTGVAMTALVAMRGRTAAVEPATFELFERVIAHWSTMHNPALLVTAARNLVILLGRVSRHEDAVELWAAVSGIDDSHPSYGAEAGRLDATLRAARHALGPAFDDAAGRGRSHAGLTGVATLASTLCQEATQRLVDAAGTTRLPTTRTDGVAVPPPG